MAALCSFFVAMSLLSTLSCISVAANEISLSSNSKVHDNEGRRSAHNKNQSSILHKSLKENNKQKQATMVRRHLQSCTDGSGTSIQINLRTDQAGYEVYWQLSELGTDFIPIQGGTSLAMNQNLPRDVLQADPEALSVDTAYQADFCMEDGTNYVFQIWDSAGDGICCTFGDGTLIILVDDEEVYNSGVFGYTQAITLGPLPNSSSSIVTDGDVSNCNDFRQYKLYLTLPVDIWASEVSWKITVSGDDTNVVASSSDLGGLQSSTNYDIRRCLDKDTNYDLWVQDSAGDGIGGDVTYQYHLTSDGNPNGDLNVYQTMNDFGNGHKIDLQTGTITPLSSAPTPEPPSSDVADGDFSACSNGNDAYQFFLRLRTDSFASETSWRITTSGQPNDIIYESSADLMPATIYEFRRCLSKNRDYDLWILDSLADGIGPIEGSPDFTYNIQFQGSGAYLDLTQNTNFGAGHLINLQTGDIVPLNDAPVEPPTPSVDAITDGSFEDCNFNDYRLLLILPTDAYPSEISWIVNIVGSIDSIIDSSNNLPYSLAENSIYEFRRCLNPNQEYELRILDSAGDGIGSIADPARFQYVVQYQGSDWTIDKTNPSYDLGYGIIIDLQLGAEIPIDGATFGPPTVPPIGEAPVIVDGSAGSCAVSQSELLIEIRTDNFPSEISWVVVNSEAGATQFSSSDAIPIDSTNTLYQVYRCLPSGGQFVFTINDSFGDGIGEPGFYQLSLDSATYFGNGAIGSSASVSIPDFQLVTANANLDGSFDGCASSDYQLLIRLGTDDFSSETSVQVRNSGTNEIIYASNELSFAPNSAYEIRRCLPANDEYIATVFDSFGDGLGTNGYFFVELDGTTFELTEAFENSASVTIPDLILLEGDTGIVVSDGPFGNCNENNRYEIMLVLRTDDYPSETSWDISMTNGNVVHSSSDSSVTFEGNTRYEIKICVNSNQDYVLNINDSYGDGITGSGFFEVSLGGQTYYGQGFQFVEPVAIPQLERVTRVVEDGDFAACNANSNYQLFVTMQTDIHAGETSWSVSESQTGSVVFASAEGSFQPGTLYEIRRCLPKSQDYIFTVNDSFGDGLCCGGFFEVRLEDSPFTPPYNDDGTFLFSRSIAIPSLTVVSATRLDGSFEDCSSNDYQVLVILNTDSYPYETSWDITERDSGTLVASSLDNTVFEAGTEYEIRRCLPSNQVYFFTIYDSYGDGLASDPAYTIQVNGQSFQPPEPFTISQRVSIPDLQLEEIGSFEDGSFDNCGSNQYRIRLEIRTDGFPLEISWEITDTGNGMVEHSSADFPMTIANAVYEYRRCVPIDQNQYTLTINDSFGDGITGEGYFIAEVFTTSEKPGEYYSDGLFGFFQILSIPNLIAQSQVILDGSHSDCLDGNNDYQFFVSLLTDAYPTEISWEIADFSTGVSVFTSSDIEALSPSIPNAVYEIRRCLPKSATYVFTIFDSYGDGLSDPGSVSACLGNDPNLPCVGYPDFGASQRISVPDMTILEAITEDGTFDACLNGNNPLQFYASFKTDGFPAETSWDITNRDTGNVVFASNQQGAINSFQRETFYEVRRCLPANQNYVFNIYDSFGDGICCGDSGGYTYQVNFGGQINLVQPGNFGFVESVDLQTGEVFRPGSCDSGPAISVAVTTEQFGSLTGWEIRDLSTPGDDIVESRNSFNQFSTVEDLICPSSEGPFQFTIYDGAGYTVTYNGNIVAGGQQFSGSRSTVFGPFQSRSQFENACQNVGGQAFVLEILTDSFPQETLWNVTDALGILESTGGEYSDAGTNYEDYRCFQSGEVYSFNIYDTQSDGICCSYGSGQYSIRLDGSTIYTSNGEFGAGESVVV